MLTKRQIETMNLLSAGLTNKEIGALRGVTVRTVKQTLLSVRYRLGERETPRVLLAEKWHCELYRIGAGVPYP